MEINKPGARPANSRTLMPLRGGGLAMATRMVMIVYKVSEMKQGERKNVCLTQWNNFD
jgi:hypothetical protein